ncbi:hypothetical protein HY442_01490, partial [Candidatus Parcubacteria bacterium]|nr:hypothetical protein [Candidatus Parcubacteria bacterium]
DGSWNPAIEVRDVRLGNLVVGRLEYERDYEERGSRNQLKRYQYAPAFQTDSAGIVREGQSQRIAGRLRKQADGQLVFTGYQRLEYPQGSGTYFHVPGPRDASGRGPAGAALDANGQFVPYFVGEQGAVTGLRKRFFGQITNAGFTPAFTINFRGQTYDINLANGEVYSVDGARTGLVVTRAGANYEVHQGGPSGALLGTISGQTGEARTPEGALAGTVGVGAQPFISFGDYIRSKLGASSGFRRQEFPGETMGEPSWGGVSPAPTPLGPSIFVNLSGEPGGGFAVSSGDPTYPFFVGGTPGGTGGSFAIARPDFTIPISENGSFIPAASAGGAGTATLSLPAFDISSLVSNRPAPDMEAQIARFVEQDNANPQLVRDILESTPNAPEILQGIGVRVERPVVPGTTAPESTPAFPAGVGAVAAQFGAAQFGAPVVIPEMGDVVQVLPDGSRVRTGLVAGTDTVINQGLRLRVTNLIDNNPGPGQGSIVGGLFGGSVIVYGGETSRSVAVIPDGGYTETNDTNVVAVGSTMYTYANPPRLSPAERTIGNEYGAIPTVPLRENGRETKRIDAFGNIHGGSIYEQSPPRQSSGPPFQALRPSGDEPSFFFDSGEFVLESASSGSEFGPEPPRRPATLTAIPFAFRVNENTYAAEINLNGSPSEVRTYGPLDATGVRMPQRTDFVALRDGTIARRDPRTGGVSAPLYEVRGFNIFEYGSTNQVGRVMPDQQFLLFVNPSTRLTRQSAARIGYVNVSGTNYFFELAGPNAGSDWQTMVGTSVRGAAVQGDVGYRLTLGSLELPDGVHQAYLVHQGDTPGIFGFIDRSEETRPGFRGQFSTFTQSTAVLTADGTIRDMTTGGILRGVPEADLMRTATASVNEVPPLTLQGEAAPNAITAHGIIIEGGGEPVTPVVSVRDPEVGTALRLFSFDKTLSASLDKSLSLSAFGTPLRVVGLSYGESVLMGPDMEQQFTFAAEPTYARENNRQIVEFKVAKRIAFPSFGAPIVQYPQRVPGLTIAVPESSAAPRTTSVGTREVIRYDVESGTLTYYGADGAPKSVPLAAVRFILALPEGTQQGSGTVFAYLRGPITPERAREAEANLSQNQAVLYSLELFARQQNLLPARQPRRLSLYITEPNDPDIPAVALWEEVDDDTSAIIIAPSVPVLDQSRAKELLELAHEFGHYVSIDRDDATIDEYGLLLRRFKNSRLAADGEALSRFVAEEKRFASPERRADVFSSSVASWFVLSNTWTSEFAYQLLAQVFAVPDAAIKKFAGSSSLNTAFALQLHDSPEERLQNMRYAFDFYLRHPELLGGSLTLPQAPTGRIQSRISRTAAAPSPTTASPIAGGFVKAGGGAVGPFVEQTPSEHLPQLGFFGVFATSPAATSTATTTAPVLFSAENVLQASSTDQITFRWAKAPGAESYWYSSDLTKISGTNSYSWVRFDDQPGIVDRGDFFELTFPASTFPPGEHWFQITAGSADNRADWARTDTGYPFLFVRLRLAGEAGSVLRVAPIEDKLFWRQTPLYQRSGYLTRATLVGKFTAVNEGQVPAIISSLTIRPTVPEGFRHNVGSMAGIEMRDTQGVIIAFTHSSAVEVSAGGVRFTFTEPMVVPPWQKVAVVTNVALEAAMAPEQSYGNFVSQEIEDIGTGGSLLGSDPALKFGESMLVPSDYETPHASDAYAELDSRLLTFILRQQPSRQEVIDYFINTWKGDFSRVLRASIKGNVPLIDILTAFRQQGYLRQVVQSALRQGAPPEQVMAALKGLNVSFEELRQLQGYFGVSDRDFRDLLAGSGFDAGTYFTTQVRSVGFHLVSDRYVYGFVQDSELDRQYQRLVLKAVYLVPRGQRAQPNWREGVEIVMREAARVYQRELRQEVTVEYQIYPMPIEGEQVAQGYDNNNTTEIMRRVFRRGGDRYDAAFSRRGADEYDSVITFVEMGSELIGNGFGFPEKSVNDYQRDDIPAGSFFGNASWFVRDGEFSRIVSQSQSGQGLPSRPFASTLHEIGHTLGLPHAWEVLENPGDVNLNSSFHNVVGHVMAYSGADILPEDYFVPDSLINLLLGRPSLSRTLPRPVLHNDPVLPVRDPRLPLADNLITYINTESTGRRVPDGLILRALLSAGVPTDDIIDAFRAATGGGVGRLIRAAREAGVSSEEIVLTLWNYGFTVQQLESPVVFDAINFSPEEDRGYRFFNAVEPKKVLQARNLIAPSPPASSGRG